MMFLRGQENNSICPAPTQHSPARSHDQRLSLVYCSTQSLVCHAAQPQTPHGHVALGRRRETLCSMQQVGGRKARTHNTWSSKPKQRTNAGKEEEEK